MELSIWYRHFLRHESGEDTFIPDEENENDNEMPRTKHPASPGPVHEGDVNRDRV